MEDDCDIGMARSRAQLTDIWSFQGRTAQNTLEPCFGTAAGDRSSSRDSEFPPRAFTMKPFVLTGNPECPLQLNRSQFPLNLQG